MTSSSDNQRSQRKRGVFRRPLFIFFLTAETHSLCKLSVKSKEHFKEVIYSTFFCTMPYFNCGMLLNVKFCIFHSSLKQQRLEPNKRFFNSYEKKKKKKEKVLILKTNLNHRYIFLQRFVERKAGVWKVNN